MIHFLIRALKVLGLFVTGVVLALLLVFLYYDLTEFQPRRDGIAKLIADAHPAERLPPVALRKLMLTDGGRGLSLPGQARLWIRPERSESLVAERDALLARAYSAERAAP